jgi:hypothetical protein
MLCGFFQFDEGFLQLVLPVGVFEVDVVNSGSLFFARVVEYHFFFLPAAEAAEVSKQQRNRYRCDRPGYEHDPDPIVTEVFPHILYSFFSSRS